MSRRKKGQEMPEIGHLIQCVCRTAVAQLIACREKSSYSQTHKQPGKPEADTHLPTNSEHVVGKREQCFDAWLRHQSHCLETASELMSVSPAFHLPG